MLPERLGVECFEDGLLLGLEVHGRGGAEELGVSMTAAADSLQGRCICKSAKNQSKG